MVTDKIPDTHFVSLLIHLIKLSQLHRLYSSKLANECEENIKLDLLLASKMLQKTKTKKSLMFVQSHTGN